MRKRWLVAVGAVLAVGTVAALRHGEQVLFQHLSRLPLAPPPCTLQQLGRGKWNFSPKRKAPYCCLGGNSQQKNCTPNPEITLEQRGQQNVGNGCYCDVDLQFGPKWEPEATCLLEDFSPPKFCQALVGRRLVFVGDSLAHQFQAVTLGLTMQERTDTCGGQIVHRLSDTFRLFPHDRGDRLDLILQEEMERARLQNQTPVFVVCVGAHLYFGPDSDEAQLVANYGKLITFAQAETARLGVKLWIIPITPAHSCVIHWPNGRVAWRNVSQAFHFPHIPAMLRELYRMGDELNILPVYDALDQRPDAHSWWDCLHFCIPGPLQVGPQFISHLLQHGLF